MIQFFHKSRAKKPESGLFSDWIGNNTDDLRCSDWPKRRHPSLVVDFSLHFCLRNEQRIHAFSSRNFKRQKFHVGRGKCLRMSCEREMSVWSMEMSANLNTHA